MIIAGPCSIDKHFIPTCLKVAELGATHLRAGLFKPRSGASRWAGMGNEGERSLELGLEMMKEVKARTGLKIVAEALSEEQIEILYDYVDVFQIGTRNQTASELLRAFGRQDKPIILKRGMATTLEEFIQYISYITYEGNNDVVLCERGIRTFETATRNTFDISAIPYLKQNTTCKVIGDPSHGTGVRDLVIPVSLACLAAGADGIMVEVHEQPDLALTDGPQSLYVEQFAELMKKVKAYGQIN